MNTKNLLLSSLIGAITITVMANTPFLNLINCILCSGFWLGAILAVWLYKRQAGSLTMDQAIKIGALTGLFAGILGFLLSFVGLAGAGGLVTSLNQALPTDARIDFDSSALAGPLGILFNLIGMVVNVMFGALGGYLSGIIINRQPKPRSA